MEVKRLINFKIKLASFTLAEVLITLGIIGVVAAMTIPNLMSSVNLVQNKAKFKKELSVLNQAVRFAQANYDVNFAAVDECYAEDETLEEGVYSMCSIFNTTLSGATFSVDPPANYFPSGSAVHDEQEIDPETGEIKTISSQNVPLGYGTYPVFYTLADGAILSFDSSAKACTKKIGLDLFDLEAAVAGESRLHVPLECYGFIDVNGISPPNKEVLCEDGSHVGIEDKKFIGCKPDKGDIFPVVFYDGTVEPASAPARYVIRTSK